MSATLEGSIAKWQDHFVGHRVYSATPGSNIGHNWLIVDTSSAGTPTYEPLATGPGAVLTFDNTSEVQNVCMAFGDNLAFDIDDIIEAKFRVVMGQTTLDSTTSLAFGLAGARNDAIDSIAQHALFRLIGSNSLVCETDDGTTDTDDVATGKSLSTTATDFTISFATGKADIRFFIGGQPVATSTTFSMAAYTGALQPLVQLQKTADTNTDSVTVSLVSVTYRV